MLPNQRYEHLECTSQSLSTHRQNKKRNLPLLRHTICTKRDETLIQAIRQLMHSIWKIVSLHVHVGRNTLLFMQEFVAHIFALLLTA